MRIAVLGANGKTGRLVSDECLQRGMDVTAFVRRADAISNPKVKVVVKDIASLIKSDLLGFDAVVNCFGTWTPETLPLHIKYTKHLCDLLSGTDTRLVIVGGAGSLYLDREHTVQLYQSESFPAEYLEIAKSQVVELEYLRQRSDVKWTFFSPAAEFDYNGVRTGCYVLGGEEFILNEDKESYISYADYALALVDELENGKFVDKRFTAVGRRKLQ